MELALRGLGASSAASWCDPNDPVWCRLCGNCPKPYGDIRDRQYNSVGMEAYCWLYPEEATCKVPTQEEILGSDVNAGGQLTPESRAAATDMAMRIVKTDCQTHPELYTEIPGSCSYVEPAMPSWFLIGGFIGVAILLLALKR